MFLFIPRASLTPAEQERLTMYLALMQERYGDKPARLTDYVSRNVSRETLVRS